MPMFDRGKTIFKRIISPQDKKLPDISSGNAAQTSDGGRANGISPSKDGRANKEAQQELAKERIKNDDAIYNLLGKSNRVLTKLSSVFPFDLFPDQISVDPMKVNIVSRDFFFSPTTHTIYIKNILDVIVECSPFFATIKIMYEGFGPNTVNVKFLKKKEAQRTRRIIQGLVVARREGVDLTDTNIDELLRFSEKLGEAKALERSVY